MSSGSKIIIECLRQDQMRYDTTGDWSFDKDGNLVIQVVGGDPLDHDEAFLVALHELIEVKLCLKAGVTQGAVDAFDFKFTGDGEPGDHPDAPYREQHRKAMLIEHLMANFLGMSSYGEVT
jgi:hypothetical protein